jgi:small subunit ribosomal protein S16
MLKIRLARVGKKKQPTYRFVVSDRSKDTYGKALEILGHYNPFTKVCEVKKDRILYWIEKGAKPSPTVHNLFIDQNVISGQKVKASKAGKKSQEQQAEAAQPSSAEAQLAPATEPAPSSETAAESEVQEKPAEEPKE